MSATGDARATSLPTVSEHVRSRQQRRWGPDDIRRGWLVRRALLAADIVGLSLAYVISRVALPPSGSAGTEELWKSVVFVATLPAWIVLAKLLDTPRR